MLKTACRGCSMPVQSSRSAWVISTCELVLLSERYFSLRPYIRSTNARTLSFAGSSRFCTLARHSMPAAKIRTKTPAVPRPSASVLVVSPTNQILLLHRVQSSSAFPSAHVFPGGNLDAFHDGHIPEPDDPQRHEDGRAYRLAAIRETFEESGLLLARNSGFGRLLEVSQEEREEGRKKVYNKEIEFNKWLAAKGGIADIDGLVPFTRWLTPTNIPKRFTTQMYLYFLPLSTSTSLPSTERKESLVPAPTSDGGIEHTAARFLPASSWEQLAKSGEVIMYPPQVFLLSLVAKFLPLSPPSSSPYKEASLHEELQRQRKALKEFIKTGTPSLGERCISPVQLFRRMSDKRIVLGLHKPGEELEGSQRKGVSDMVVLVDFRKEGPHNVEIHPKCKILEEERDTKASNKAKM